MKSPVAYKRGDKIDGRYFVHQALHGERSEVYLCLDLETSRTYALKTIPGPNPHVARQVEAFHKEVAVRVALEKHPNIVRCHHHRTIGNRPFIFLEWVPGDEGVARDVRDWISHNKLNLQQSLNFAIAVCRGLVHAGEKLPGIVHGWLKPGNLLVGKGGVVKINDFGQPVRMQGSSLAPVTISAAPYLAPEQWENGELDPRTDLYALGSILFEMLTGAPPFEAETLEEFHRLHTKGEIPRLAEILRLPPELDLVLSECLAKNKGERFSSARELLGELSKIYQQLFSLSPSTDQGKHNFVAVEYRSRAQTYASLKRFDDALADIEQALESAPENPDVFYERGLIYEQGGYFDKALADFTHAIELDAFNDNAYAARGNVYRKLFQYELALNDQRRALEINPESVLAHAHRGNTYFNLHRNEEALADFDKAIQLDSSEAMVYFNRGSTLMYLERFEEAVKDYSRCIEADFGGSSSYTHRAAAYLRLERHEEAMEDIFRAFDINSKDPAAHFLLGEIHTVRQQYEAAVNDYSIAIKHGYEPLSYAYLKRGIVYSESANFLSAIADLDRAIELNPQIEIAYGVRAEAQNQLGNYREALADINKAFEVGEDFSESANAYNCRSKAYWGLGAFEEALADANRALAMEPEAERSYFNRANAYSGLKRFQDAIKDYDRAIEHNSSYAMSFNNRGASHAALEDYDKALIDLVQAIRLDSNCALAFRNIGIVLDKKGAKERALLYFAAAIRLGDAVAAEAYPIHHMEVLRAALESGRMESAHNAFTSAGSYPDMLLAAAQYSFLTDQLSIASKEHALEEMSSSPFHSMWAKQVKWLKECASDTPTPDIDDPKLFSAGEHEVTFIDTARAKQAVAAYDSVLEQHTAETSLLVNKGVALGLLGRVDEALACHKQALQIDPNQTYAYYFMGIILRKSGNFDEALSCYDRALEIKPEETEFWSQKARIFRALGKEDEEINCYDQILVMDPQDENALINKAVIFGRKGEYTRVVEFMDRVLQDDPELEPAWFYKGLALRDLELHGEAIDCFDKALEIDPAKERTWTMKGEALRDLGRNEEAAVCFVKLTELITATATSLERAGGMLFNMGKFEEAVTCYEHAINRSPQHDEAWFGRGIALGELGRGEEAISSYDQAIEINPRNILAWFNKGVILVNSLKDYSKAVKCFEQAELLGHEEAGQIIVSIKEAQAAEGGSV